MTSVYGIGLANGSQDIQRVISVGFDHYLALEGQIDYLLQCPNEKYLRLWCQDFRPVDEIRRVIIEYRKRGIRHYAPWNEANLPVEVGESSDKLWDSNWQRMNYERIANRYLELLNAVQYLDIVLHFPAWSPNVWYRENLDVWKTAAMAAPVVDVHTYGNLAQMMGIVDWYLSVLPGKDIFISEFNPGAGNTFDPNWWADEAVRFYEALYDRPRVIAACGFIWTWHDPDSRLGTTLDWEGQPIEVRVKNTPKRDKEQQVEVQSIISRPSPNFGYPRGTHGRNGQQTVAIIDHITGGSFVASDGWFLNPNSFVSAHYIIRKDGVVFQYVDEKDAAWGAGIDFSKGYDSYKSDLSVPLIKWFWDSKINPNLVCVHVEHESTGEVLTESQYQSSLALHKEIIKRYNIQIDRLHIIGHYQTDGVNRPSDPGKNFPWNRLMSDLGGVDVDGATKVKVSGHLNILWGCKEKLAEINQPLNSPVIAQLAQFIEERVLAIKRDVGIS